MPSRTSASSFSTPQSVEDEFSALSIAVSNAANDGTDRSVGLTLGTLYPPRLLSSNPPPVEGTVRTRNSGAVVVSGLCGTGSTDLCATGTDTLSKTGGWYEDDTIRLSVTDTDGATATDSASETADGTRPGA